MRDVSAGREVLVIDGANVVGSRPDGWWRDRAGAARRLREQLIGADLAHHEVVLVLEGKARSGAEAGRVGPLTVVHAPGSGDEAIVGAVENLVAEGRQVLVVTADRALRARLDAAGASSVGPSWLLGRL